MANRSSQTRDSAARRLVACLLVMACVAPVPALAAKPSTADATSSEAVIVSKQALDFFLKGNHAVASELYQKAYALSAKPEYLYGMARAEHEAGHIDAAIAGYEQCLAALAQGDALYVKTLHYLQKARNDLAAKPVVPVPALVPKTTPPAPTPAPAPTPVPEKIAPPPDKVAPEPKPAGPVVHAAAETGTWRTPVGWGGVGLGVAGIVGAVIVYAGTSSDQEALDGRLIKKAGTITGITFEEAKRQQDGINERILIAWGLGGVGVVAGAVGAWLIASDAAPAVTVGPGPGQAGLQVAWRF